MTHIVNVGLIVQTLGTVLYVALGVWVLTLTPRRLQTKLLAAFAILFGMTDLQALLGVMFHLLELGSPLFVALLLSVASLSSVVALGLAWAVPKPLGDRRLLGTAAALGVAFPLVTEGIQVAAPGFEQGTLPVWVGYPLVVVSEGAFLAALFLFALRARPARDPSRGDVTQLALLGVALAMLFAFVRGTAVSDLAGSLARDQPAFAAVDALHVVVFVLVAGVWGWNMIQADDDTAKIHRAAMLGILGLLTAGAVHGPSVAIFDPSFQGMRGVVRTLGVGLLAYGILRHDIAGLDEKVEFGVSRTTVAGVFVAVFFVVSEAAQVLFAGFAGSEILGVLAAGALVFFLAPIQRAADELAQAVVPSGGSAAGSAAQAEETYRQTVADYLADGELTTEEEHHLGRLAGQLDIDAERALEIREEVEDGAESGDGGDAG